MLHFIYTFTILACVSASNWDTYPAVPKTASINGFADPIMSNLPACATDCVSFSVSNTPCPYWDTGCLCVMPQWSGEVAECIVSACTAASDVAKATSAAYSLCSSVGANVWMMPASLSTALQKAGSVTNAVAASTAMSESFAVTESTSPAVTAAPSSSSTSSATSSISSGNSSNSVGSSSTAASSSQQSSANSGIAARGGGLAFFMSMIAFIFLS